MGRKAKGDKEPKPAPPAPAKARGRAATAALASAWRANRKRRGRGRPSEYQPRFCEQLVDHMAQGFSFESFAGVVGVSKQTLYNWAEAHAEFLDAKERGTEQCRLWWEDLGIEGVQGYGPRVLQEETAEAIVVEGQLATYANGQPIMKIKRKFGAAQFVPGTWFRNMTNRFPDEWRDRQDDARNGEGVLPPMVDWGSLGADPHVQAFMAQREAMLAGAREPKGVQPIEGAGGRDARPAADPPAPAEPAAGAEPEPPAPKRPPVRPL